LPRAAWLDRYPPGVPDEIDPDRYRSIAEVFRTACERFRDKPAFSNMGATLSFGELERLSADFAAFLRNDLGLAKGDRIAPRVIVTEVADLFPGPKRLWVNAAVRYLKRMVPAFDVPGAIRLRDALAQGRRHARIDESGLSGQDLAFLQYTGGTTGTPKAAMLTHRNIVSNMEQASAWMSPLFVEGTEVVLTPLPLYHIFSLTVNCLLFLKWGALNVLVTNPRDFPGFIKLLGSQRLTVMTAVSTLLNALMSQPGFGGSTSARSSSRSREPWPSSAPWPRGGARSRATGSPSPTSGRSCADRCEERLSGRIPRERAGRSRRGHGFGRAGIAAMPRRCCGRCRGSCRRG
jgi:acyl-CoA synthetase (AMP-forming)/AMP-acid ligase II